MYVINEAKYPLSTPTNTAQSPENPNHKRWRVASAQTSLPEATSDHEQWFTKRSVVCWEDIYFHHDDHQISKKLKVLHWWYWGACSSVKKQPCMSITCFSLVIFEKNDLNDDIWNSVQNGVRQPSRFFWLGKDIVFLLKNWKSAQKAATTYEIKQSIHSDNVTYSHGKLTICTFAFPIGKNRGDFQPAMLQAVNLNCLGHLSWESLTIHRFQFFGWHFSTFLDAKFC